MLIEHVIIKFKLSKIGLELSKKFLKKSEILRKSRKCYRKKFFNLCDDVYWNFLLFRRNSKMYFLAIQYQALLNIYMSFEIYQTAKFSRLCLLWLGASVTRWLHYYSIFGHLQQWQLAQQHINAIVGQILNPKIAQRLFKFCQSGEIFKILVTLVAAYD